MNHIHIIPIFDQRAPLIWPTFVAIQHAAMLAAYKYKTSHEEMALNITQMNMAWHREPCYAFAAYDGYNKMVGCIHGCVGQPYTTVNGLYVLPEYRKMGLGSKLLTASENAASLYADVIRLTALWQSRNFYRAHKYNIVSARDGLCEKNINISAQNGKVIPIFVCSNNVAAQCDNIAKMDDAHFDAADINIKHLPMFAHLNAEMKIDGYILAAPYRQGTDVRASQLCLANPERHDIACHLIESMATMNIR